MIQIYDVITVGSSTIDVFGDTSSELIRIKTKKYMEDHICYPSGVKLLIKSLNFKIGGGGVNTAVCLSRLGLKVAYLGCIGNDANGELIIRRLKQNKVDFIGVQSKYQTGYAMILDSLAHDRTILKFSGANDHLRYKDIDKKQLKTKWLYLASMVDESYFTNEKLAKFAKMNKIKLAFNPSNYVIKGYFSKIPYIISKCDVFSVNETEAYLLTGLEGCKAQLRAIKRLGPKHVIITAGPEGAYYSDGKQYLHVLPSNVKVKEVTGAGDTFCSSCVAGLIKKPNDIRFALKMAKLNAESVIGTMGAHGGLLDYAGIQKAMRRRIIIKKL